MQHEMAGWRSWCLRSGELGCAICFLPDGFEAETQGKSDSITGTVRTGPGIGRQSPSQAPWWARHMRTRVRAGLGAQPGWWGEGSWLGGRLLVTLVRERAGDDQVSLCSDPSDPGEPQGMAGRALQCPVGWAGPQLWPQQGPW